MPGGQWHVDSSVPQATLRPRLLLGYGWKVQPGPRHTAPGVCPPGRSVQCWHWWPGSQDVRPDEDGWDEGLQRQWPEPSKQQLSFQEIPCGREAVLQMSRCAWDRSLLTETQMDINVSWPRRHLSAGPSLAPTAPPRCGGWVGATGQSRTLLLRHSPLRPLNPRP
ncbi:Hypothetical predicted protein [Marmota monax]|uniref:Uncharacterized protein n=1 Tax=Marmota monax TaxID=9995 RepID=A0A5E4BII8_MARMO|nr:Hypothetical predicted protein [Marmota monax]